MCLNRLAQTNVCSPTWVLKFGWAAFKVGRIVEVFAVRVGVVFKVEDINDFFDVLPKVVVWHRKRKFILCNLHLCKLHILS